MSKRSIKIIIIVTTVALVGLIFTQTFWINSAYQLSKQQFNHRVDMALDDVIEEMLRRNEDKKYSIDKNFINEDYAPTGLLDVLEYNNLDSLINQYFTFHKVNSDYEYLVKRSRSDTVLYSTIKNINYKKQKPHSACFNSLWCSGKYHIEVFFPVRHKAILIGSFSWILLSVIFIVIIIFSFTFTILSIFKEKKVSEIRDDFINNMTHEFKTPISTISVASEMLMNNGLQQNGEKMRHYAQIIFDENKRMKMQVDRVLQAAILSKDAFEMDKTMEDLHKVIKDLVPSMLMVENGKDIHVNYILKAKSSELFVDKMHLINIIKNLIDNAIKYSNQRLELNIYSIDIEEGILLSVEDNGIGIASETVKHIFEKFYRKPTGDLHNVKGFGLGLYYVKTMTEAHGGYVKVKSELNKGTRFDIYLPFGIK